MSYFSIVIFIFILSPSPQSHILYNANASNTQTSLSCAHITPTPTPTRLTLHTRASAPCRRRMTSSRDALPSPPLPPHPTLPTLRPSRGVTYTPPPRGATTSTYTSSRAESARGTRRRGGARARVVWGVTLGGRVSADTQRALARAALRRMQTRTRGGARTARASARCSRSEWRCVRLCLLAFIHP